MSAEIVSTRARYAAILELWGIITKEHHRQENDHLPALADNSGWFRFLPAIVTADRAFLPMAAE